MHAHHTALVAGALTLAHGAVGAQPTTTACEQDANLSHRFDCACMANKRAELLQADPSMNPTIAEMTATWYCPNLAGLHTQWLRECRQGTPRTPIGYNTEAFCACYVDQRAVEQRKVIGKRSEAGADATMLGLANTACTVRLRGKTTPELAWGPTLLGTWRLNVEGSVEMRLVVNREDTLRTNDGKTVRQFTGVWQFADGRDVGNAGIQLWVTPEPPTLTLRIRHWGCDGPYNESSPLAGRCHRGALAPLPYTLVRETR
ncbi:MAG: hypothetical protein IV093_18255 [Rubrivivax sp.]|nr:hypothetical protein [Rubrivivax sp.]